MFNPFPNHHLSFFQAVKNLPVQKIVSEGAIKAFAKAVLLRAAWGDVSSLDAYAR